MSSGPMRTPVSQIILSKHDQDAEEEPKKKSREDWRKAKELEEARKAGTAPAAVDEEGRDINPHIPQYISNAPWYYGSAGPTLKHQRPQHEDEQGQLDKRAPKGLNTTRIITKFRKGACENCGAVTHKRKDCLERPRKVQAKYAESIVVHDEHLVNEAAVNYDEKRDRWSSYDPANHREIIEEYEKVEEAKRQLKAEKLKNDPDAEISDEEGNEDKYVDEVDMPGTKVDSKQRITVRNLRIREDTAKYLRNLDPNSAYYDPKTRSMRDNPNPAVPEEEAEFAGENFVRFSGDTTAQATAQLFAWEAHGKGVDVHLLAEPTKLELLQKEYEQKKEQFKSSTKTHIVEKYGGEEHLQVPPKSLLLAQTEEYIEYSRSGKVIKGVEKPKARSIYEEDVYINNHTTVWGSFWNAGRWGYKCCKSFIKNSYCVGMQEPEGYSEQHPTSSTAAATTEPEAQSQFKVPEVPPERPASEVDSASSSESSLSEEEEVKPEKKKSKKKSKKREKKKKAKEQRKQKAKNKETKDKEQTKEKDIPEELDDRKRAYNSMYDVKAPTEDEIEEWKKKRPRAEDPMLQFM
ncbi:pre-mRNA-splicing factor Slu7 [Drosophila sechellia]|uniref:Pre-mRNA-splicing factor SLU7 n=1 Tax=Drosophila mauritiana TaxID=7226 RepID=A0A6P8KE87_DROMA|nr:pre-mRNA-splicing factor Slu7 [Drosophila sechellia]XP_033167555.1 pre-mRNA-splicing factor Slu7 [Drosophila mauritiana]